MSYRGVKSYLLACTSAAVLLAAAADANAGGFALREQSAYGQGSSFAGVAAGGALSSMYWNPSIMTQFNGKTIEGDARSSCRMHRIATPAVRSQPRSRRFMAHAPATAARTPWCRASYSSWQINDRFWLGMSVNAPFGLGVQLPDSLGRRAAYGQDAKACRATTSRPRSPTRSTTGSASSIGVQLQYMTVTYDAFLTTAPRASASA